MPFAPLGCHAGLLWLPAVSCDSPGHQLIYKYSMTAKQAWPRVLRMAVQGYGVNFGSVVMV